MSEKKPLILISNDDGIHAPGIHALAKSISPLAEVYIVAPHTERSAYSHCLTISTPLRLHKVDSKPYSDNIYEVDGTPVDCVKIALKQILPRKPDWVFTGINRGGNLGTDVLYSGTVGAAMEAVLGGCRAIAFSSHSWDKHKFNYDGAAKIARILLENSEKLQVKLGTMLNVNIPSKPFSEIKGIEIASLGKRIYDERYWKKEDPRGLPYYWLGAETQKSEDIPGSDCNFLQDGYASVSVLKPSMLCENGQESLAGLLPGLLEHS